MSDEAAVKNPPAPADPRAAPAPQQKPSASTRTAAPTLAAEKKGKAKKASGKEKGNGKRKGKQEVGASVAAHPRASAQVRLAKGWGGIGGFAIAGYLSLRVAVPPDVAALRAIAAGAVGYVLGWACAVMVWRHLVAAELRAFAERQRKRAEEEPGPATASSPSSTSSSGT